MGHATVVLSVLGAIRVLWAMVGLWVGPRRNQSVIDQSPVNLIGLGGTWAKGETWKVGMRSQALTIPRARASKERIFKQRASEKRFSN